jgi:predicted O-methyltransferase YrrM
MATYSYKMSYFEDYSTDLCAVASGYGTDKCSDEHCHGYTLFYKPMFAPRQQDALNVAEIGVAKGASIKTWCDYFPQSQIYGFDVDSTCIEEFRANNNNPNVHLSYMDVCDADSISNGFKDTNVMFDLIIDDSTNVFEDQVRIVRNAYKYLKPGGFLIIEDIMMDAIESTYDDELWDVLREFKDSYFVVVEHARQDPDGLHNHKLLVFVRAGGPHIFWQFYNVLRT